MYAWKSGGEADMRMFNYKWFWSPFQCFLSALQPLSVLWFKAEVHSTG